MNYDSDSLRRAQELFDEGVSDIENGFYGSGRSKLEEARQIYISCKGTHPVQANAGLAKTNQKLSQIQA
jgi:hypothetical protein